MLRKFSGNIEFDNLTERIKELTVISQLLRITQEGENKWAFKDTRIQ